MSTFNHVGHCVRDLERSRRFYVDALGFEPWYDLEPPDDPTDRLLRLKAPIGAQCVYLRRDGFVLELLAYAAAGTIPPARERVMNELGLTHISVSVDDIDATAAKAVEHGGSVLGQTHVGAAVMIRDPDGQLLELLPTSYRDNLPD